MGTTAAKVHSRIFPLIFFLVFLGITALATVVAAADAPRRSTPATPRGCSRLRRWYC